jgi:dipeptidase D
MNPTEHILERFAQIAAIPRCTGNETKIRAWLQAWASARGYSSQTDMVGNLVMRMPASVGYEQRPALILQGHLDMVCEKTPESTHDFTRDPIRLLREGDWLHADQTTLGADNGIGIALMLALVEDESVTHPALELLLTVAEENGMVGADNLEPSLITAKTLINLDSETVGVFTVGCAGGGSVHITLPVTWTTQSAAEVAFELRVSGLQGGHSGENINSHRANANKLLARLLDEMQRAVEIRLSVLKGGTARNAIPRAAEVVFICPAAQATLCRDVFATSLAYVQAEQVLLEPGMSIMLIEHGSEPVRAISHTETVTAIRILVALPHGVAAMSAVMTDLVETSNNIGVVELKEDGLSIISSQRSSVLSRLEELIQRIEALAWLASTQTERTKIFSPWQPNLASPILKKCVEIYQIVANEEPIVHMAHGGLECGLISKRCGGLDAISLGPRIENLHSPDERLLITSLAPTWEFLVALLKSQAD